MVGNAADIDVWLRQAAAAGHLAAMRLLLEAGANPNGFDDVEGKRGGIPGYHGRQPPKKGRLLREYSHYPDDKGTWNPYAEKAWAQSLALTRAVQKGHAAIVQLLLAAGAKVDRGDFCQQLLLQAMDQGHADIAQMLLEARRKAPQTGLDDCSAKDMEMALDHAIRAGNNLLLQVLLDTEEGRTAARDSCDLMSHAVGKDNLAAVRMLLAAGADPGSYRMHSGPSITIAVERGNRDIVQALLEAGFDLSSGDYAHVDRVAKDPLMAAVRRGDADMLALLMAWGNRKRSQYRTIFCPYRINRLFSDACTRNSVAVAQMLLDAGADPDYDNSRIDERAFYRAAGAGRADIVALLLKRGAKVNEPSRHHIAYIDGGKTALMLAAGYKRGVWSSDEGGDSARTVNLLLQAGASCNQCDHQGFTALMRAAISGNTETVRLLLKAGANRNDTDVWSRKTALEWAKENKHAETEALLRTWNPGAS